LYIKKGFLKGGCIKKIEKNKIIDEHFFQKLNKKGKKKFKLKIRFS
jgi:hypothetical protein